MALVLSRDRKNDATQVPRLRAPRAAAILASLAILGALIALGLGTVALHRALRKSPDSWAAAIEAIATVALVLITGWYAYLTFRLVQAQNLAPRLAGWEAALRELSRVLARSNGVLWTAESFFPIKTSERPPMLLDVLASRDAIREVRDQMLELVGVLPRDIAGRALGLAAYLVDAEAELHALAGALLDESQTGLSENRTWTWEGAKTAHEGAQNDPQRTEAWSDVLAGRRLSAVRKRWDEVAATVDGALMAAAPQS